MFNNNNTISTLISKNITLASFRWRRESQVLTQLQDLATRLQLQTPPPSVPITKADSRRSSKRLQNQQTAFENAGFQITEPTAKASLNGSQPQGINAFGSQNEFNASMFALPYLQQFANQANGGNRTGRFKLFSFLFELFFNLLYLLIFFFFF